jgi:hypothetical protein
MIFTEVPKEIISFIEDIQEAVLNNFILYNVRFSFNIDAPYSDTAILSFVVGIEDFSFITCFSYYDVFNIIDREGMIRSLVEKVNFFLKERMDGR